MQMLKLLGTGAFMWLLVFAAAVLVAGLSGPLLGQIGVMLGLSSALEMVLMLSVQVFLGLILAAYLTLMVLRMFFQQIDIVSFRVLYVILIGQALVEVFFGNVLVFGLMPLINILVIMAIVQDYFVEEQPIRFKKPIFEKGDI